MLKKEFIKSLHEYGITIKGELLVAYHPKYLTPKYDIFSVFCCEAVYVHHNIEKVLRHTEYFKNPKEAKINAPDFLLRIRNRVIKYFMTHTRQEIMDKHDKYTWHIRLGQRYIIEDKKEKKP
ncbi:MAG: hypothetical protein ABIJ26_01440 [Candidatus Margulisiibacteriota bacterium]